MKLKKLFVEVEFNEMSEEPSSETAEKDQFGTASGFDKNSEGKLLNSSIDTVG
jgi:hypothetical protein